MKSKKNNAFRRRIVLWGGVSVAICFSIFFSIGTYWVQIYNKNNEYQALKEKMDTLNKETEILTKNVDRLKDAEYIAKYAREKYMYSKDGEIILRIN